MTNTRRGPITERGPNGIQPTESEFEEITADTLVGPHFVRTYGSIPPSGHSDPNFLRADPNFPRRLGRAGSALRGGPGGRSQLPASDPAAVIGTLTPGGPGEGEVIPTSRVGRREPSAPVREGDPNFPRSIPSFPRSRPADRPNFPRRSPATGLGAHEVRT